MGTMLLFVLASAPPDDDMRVDRALTFFQLGVAGCNCDLRKPFMVDGSSLVNMQDGAPVPGKAAVNRGRFGVNAAATTKMAPKRFTQSVISRRSKKQQQVAMTR